uniref:Radical SAM domain protein n=1 Tax=Solibacter usitatus (strain Ellin6076) TaxID=234267 RepID=Q02AP0_SOLUE
MTSSTPVALINMPFAMANRPPLGISTLKAALTLRGIRCDVHHFNLLLANWIGPDLYQQISDRASHMVFAGEWLFAQQLFDRKDIGDVEYLEYIGTHLRVSSALIDTFVSLRPFIGPFLDRCERDVDWSRYTIVGFTSMFEQNLATLALASRIKRRFPRICIVMGGANCESEMGEQLHKSFPFLDYVFTGQSDWSFPQFVEHVITNRQVDAIRGLVHRRGGVSVSTGRPEPVGDLNRLPVPDYDDYVTQLGAYRLLGKLPVRLQFETSRGCWWGMKQHCTFCGFNAETMQFAAKSPGRVVDELEYLASRYNTTEFDAVDNILDYRAFATVLPRLAERKPAFSLFYEIKSNLRRDQVRLLAQAGVRYIQPGIESLNTQVLGVMKKGLTALQNIQVLKWCREFAIVPSWNLIYGFPDELPEAYAEMASVMRWLHHLPAPRGSGKIRLDRFSPHWSNPEAFGLRNVRPLQVYQYLYPLRDEERRRIAYFFEYDYAEPRDVPSYTEAADRAINEWRAAETAGAALIVDDAGESATIKDTRMPGVTREFRLDGWKAHAYRMLDQARPRGSLVTDLQESRHGAPSEEIIDSFLACCVESGLMLQEQDRYLALAVRNDFDTNYREQSQSTFERSPHVNN